MALHSSDSDSESNAGTPSVYRSLSRGSSHRASTIFTSEPSTVPTSIDKDKDKESYSDLRDFDPATHFPTVPESGIPNKVDGRDLNTPDRWVKRDPRLVRHTAKHPLNAETPLDALFGAGFLTPASIFFVRNHGAVPNIPVFTLSPPPSSFPPISNGGASTTPQPSQRRMLVHARTTWRIRVHGLVEYEQSFTINDLKRLFKVVTLPVTLSCSGNRRKEQNMISKTLGFNWGPGAISTALFTGVYLSDVLEYVRPLDRVLLGHIGNNKGNINSSVGHVIFEGADDDLPNGPYGTSQPLKWAMDQNKGMLLAWRMNGRDLEPDHGFPIRIVIPGQVAGRSVKWLRRIEVSTHESQHHLHFRDNRLLPSLLTAQRARDEAQWWHDPKYIIRDVTVNSAIAVPYHNEILRVPSQRPEGLHPNQPSYTLRGYAYVGGGNRVNLVEISLDEGANWQLADVEYPEDLYRTIALDDEIYGELGLTDRDTYFCWCFWSLEVTIHKLAASSSIFVRAMDDTLAVQPRDMYWNALGMMNNWWFRVAILHEQEDEVLRFEHPVVPGTPSGGWMERMQASGTDVLNPRFRDLSSSTIVPVAKGKSSPEIVTMTNPDVRKQISIAEYTRLSSSSHPHSQRKALFIVNGQVYDGTDFLNEHPGGADSIWLVVGELDASEDFLAIHSDDSKKKLAKFHIGTLVNQEANDVDKGQASTAKEAEEEESGVFLNKRKWKTVTLTSVTAVSHDSFIYRFAFASPDLELGLPVGQHVFVRLRRKITTGQAEGGELVQRAYSPVSPPNAKGHIDLLVKLYLPCAEFPMGGKMTVGFHELNVRDTVDIKGPLGSFIWQGPRDGGIRWKDVPRPGIRKLGMICAGSGITPIIQVLRAVLQHDDKDDEPEKMELWLLDANKTEEDILCREELDEYSVKYGKKGDASMADGHLRIHHTLSNAPENWAFSAGRINDEMLQKHLPLPADDALILVCGPQGMIDFTVKPGLQRLGWNVDSFLVIF